uniref:EF-hand domain-containing protein n=1 Tax=Haptolina ericina TaxID=156174 RepID=A0A7S3BHK6_9EUKA
MANNGTKGRRSISPPPKKVQMLEDAIDAVSKEAEEDGAATGPKGEKPPLIVALDLFLKRKKMRPAALLKSWDDNGDGVIQREEWLQHIQIVCPGYEEKEILDLFDSLDEDKSGMLELIEIKHLPKNLITMQVDEVKKTEKEAQSLIEEREAQKLVATEELQTAESLAGKEYSALQSAEQDVNTAQGQLADWKSKLEALAPDAPEERRQKVMRSMALRVEELEECQQTLISARGRQEAADEALMQARSRVKQLDEELEAAKESKAAAKAKAKEHQQAQARAQAGSVVGIKDVQEAKDDKTGKPKGKDGKDEGPLSNCLLISAAAGSDAQIVSIYEQMINLVFKAPAATREKFLRQLPQLGERAEAAEVDACFHVAIDLFGFGKSAANAAAFRSLKTTPAVVLADIIRSLGKSHAYAMVAVEHSANIVVKALLDKPSLGSFVSLRDPYLENEDVLTRILQPVLVLSLNPQRMSVCRRVANSLQQGKFVDLTSKTAKKSEHAQALHVFLQEFNAQGSDPGVVGKKMPLLTRLAGGIKAWSEIPPKKPAGMPKPRMDNGFGSMKALPEFIVSAPKESKWDKFRKGDKEDPIEILSQRAPPKAQPAMPAKPPSTSSCPPSPRTKSPRSGSPRAKSPRNAKGGRRSNGKGSKKVSGSIKSA